MKRILAFVLPAFAALFLFTGCGYDFLFGGELTVTITASEEIDLWYNQPTLHLRSKDGGHRIDEVLSSSADGGSAGVTVSNLNDGDWDIWITLDDFADWESSGTTVEVKSRSLTVAGGNVFLTGGLPDFRWNLYGGEPGVPAISLDTGLSQLILAEGWDYSGGSYVSSKSAFSLRGDFLDLTRIQVSYPDGTKIDSGFLGSRNFSSLWIDDVSAVVESDISFGPGSYRAILEDSSGLALSWGRTLDASPLTAFGINSVNPDPSNVWSGLPVVFTMAGWERAEGYLVILYNINSGATEVKWTSGPFASDLQEYLSPGLSSEEYFLFIAVTDATLNNPTGLEAEIGTALSGFPDAREVFHRVPFMIQNYLTPGDVYSLFAYTVHRFWGP